MVGRDSGDGDPVVMESSPPPDRYGTHTGVVVVYGDCDLGAPGRPAGSRAAKRLAIP